MDIKFSVILQCSFCTELFTFSVPGFEKVIGLSQEVCDNGQQLSVSYDTEIRECRKSCETNPDCVFFSFADKNTNYENVCALFRSCMERSTTANPRTTYQVAKGIC